MIASLLYSVARLMVEAMATWRADESTLQAEVLVLRRQVQVLQRQIKRARWTPGDRLFVAALRERMPASAWAGLMVRPKTVLGWHRQLVSRRWAAYRGRPRCGRPPITEECRQLTSRMARENPRWGYFRMLGDLLKVGP
jgi:putative transposase